MPWKQKLVLNTTDIKIEHRKFWLNDKAYPYEKLKSKIIYWKLVQNQKITKINEQRWQTELNLKDIQFSEIYQRPYKITIDTRLICLQYKVLHRILPTNKWLYLRKVKKQTNVIIVIRQITYYTTWYNVTS
jgi:hypothetical protein